jgi:hypothetical protein
VPSFRQAAAPAEVRQTLGLPAVQAEVPPHQEPEGLEQLGKDLKVGMVVVVVNHLSITTQPTGGSYYTGESKTFTVVTAGGKAPLTYQWRKGGAPIAGVPLDLDTDALEDLSAPDDKALQREEIVYVKDFLRQLHPLGIDSKVERLLADLTELLCKRETVIVFTLYTDTMDYLKEHLAEKLAKTVACFSGRGWERRDSQGHWVQCTKEQI